MGFAGDGETLALEIHGPSGPWSVVRAGGEQGSGLGLAGFGKLAVGAILQELLDVGAHGGPIIHRGEGGKNLR